LVLQVRFYSRPYPPWLMKLHCSNAHTVAFGGSLSSTFTTSTASETNSVVTQTTTPTTSPTSTGVPLAAVVGGAVGGFALLVGVVIIVLLWMRKRNQKSTEKAFLAHRETPTTSCAWLFKAVNTETKWHFHKPFRLQPAAIPYHTKLWTTRKHDRALQATRRIRT
jgi:hypothetical protein